MIRIILFVLISQMLSGCGEQPQASSQINQTEQPELGLEKRDHDFYKIEFTEVKTKDIYFFNLIDGYGQAEDFGGALIGEQACGIRFLIEKLPGLNEYEIKIGVTDQGTNTEECLIVRGIFKLTLTGAHSAKIELINKEIGFF